MDVMKKAICFGLILVLLLLSGCLNKPKLTDLEVLGATYLPIKDINEANEDTSGFFKIELKLNKAPLIIRVVEIKENMIENGICGNEIKSIGISSLSSCLGDPAYNLYIKNPIADHKLRVCFGYTAKIKDMVCSEHFILKKVK